MLFACYRGKSIRHLRNTEQKSGSIYVWAFNRKIIFNAEKWRLKYLKKKYNFTHPVELQNNTINHEILQSLPAIKLGLDWTQKYKQFISANIKLESKVPIKKYIRLTIQHYSTLSIWLLTCNFLKFTESNSKEEIWPVTV